MMQVIHYIECDSNGWRPNGVAFRCRERAAICRQNAHALAREVVSCTAVFGGQ